MSSVAGSKRKTTDAPMSAIGAFYRLDADGKRTTENPHWGSLTTKEVVEGVAAGTIEIVEEVSDAAPEVSASGDAATANNDNNS